MLENATIIYLHHFNKTLYNQVLAWAQEKISLKMSE